MLIHYLHARCICRHTEKWRSVSTHGHKTTVHICLSHPSGWTRSCLCYSSYLTISFWIVLKYHASCCKYKIYLDWLRWTLWFFSHYQSRFLQIFKQFFQFPTSWLIVWLIELSSTNQSTDWPSDLQNGRLTDQPTDWQTDLGNDRPTDQLRATQIDLRLTVELFCLFWRLYLMHQTNSSLSMRSTSGSWPSLPSFARILPRGRWVECNIFH